MSKTLISAGRFRKAAEKDQALDAFAVRKGFASEKAAINEAKRSIRFIISTQAEDRDGDTIDPKGWRLDDYKKNPVVLFGHDHFTPPIGRADYIGLEDDALVAEAVFANREEHELADTVFRLFVGGFMNATSVGFIPRKWNVPSGRDYGLDFVEQDLLEFSAVGVPSNPEAIVNARSKGVNVRPLGEWASHMMDTKGALDRAGIARKTVEDVYRVTIRDEDGEKTISVPKLSSDDLAKRNLVRGDLSKAVADPAIPSFAVSARTPGVVYIAEKAEGGAIYWKAHDTGQGKGPGAAVMRAAVEAGLDENNAAPIHFLKADGERASGELDLSNWEIKDGPEKKAEEPVEDKAGEPEEAVAAEKFTTSEEEGHSHEYEQGATVTEAAGDPEHVHAISYSDDGEAMIEAADGHSHEADSMDEAPEGEEEGEKAVKVTDFPTEGDDLSVSLQNSNYERFPSDEAKALRDEYPGVWSEGGNERGSDVFSLLIDDPSEDVIREREAWAARHFEDYQLAGVVAQVKWLVVGSRGLDHMRELLNEAKAREDESKAAKKSRLLAVLKGAAGETLHLVEDAPEERHILTPDAARKILAGADQNGFAEAVAKAIKGQAEAGPKAE